MIPGVMVSFLGRASVAVASTRDERLVPRVHFLSGWSVDPDGEGVTCLVPAAFTLTTLRMLVRRAPETGSIAAMN